MTRWLWTSAEGAVTDLSAWADGVYVVEVSGHLAPTYEFQAQQFAGGDGATLQQVTVEARSPVLGVDFVGSPAESRARLRALAHAMRPRAGMGTLAAVADDGTQRTMPCYYAKGLDGGTWNYYRFRTALEFWAPSPWWRGDPYTYSWDLAAPTVFFPVFPLLLSQSTVAGVVTIDLSDTDAPTYPRWFVTGPGSQLTLANNTTGKQLVLNAAIGDGQTVLIDTAPGRQMVRQVATDPFGGGLLYGASLFGSLASDPAMWPLRDGVNEVSAVLTNAGPASRISLTADRLYSGAI